MSAKMKVVIGVGWFLCSMAVAGAAGGKDTYYTEPEVYAMRPDPAQEKALDCIGATGIKARFYPGVILKVEGFTEKSPAQGKLKVGEIIAGVNGVELKGINPFVALGQALTAAEASDGRMVFDVKASKDAEVRKVTVVIPVLGKYRDTWPLNCEKSKKIIKAAADYYATDPEFRKKCFSSAGGGIPSALACLFLLSTGDDAYLPVVKAYFASFPKEVARIGDHTWNNGYNGIACAEYYLRTGDPEVLPILQYYCDDAKERQMFGCGWNHWGREQNVAYVAGGLMNPAGIQVLTTLLLGKACGVRVDEKTLLGSLKFFYRFAGHGTQAYGDHRPEGGLGSNGKDGMAAAAMRAAMQAVGDTTRYEMAMKHLSLCTLNSYPIMIMGHADEGRGDGLWRGTASSYMLDYKPADYHAEMKRLRWFYDLSRRPSGAFGMAGCQGFDDVGSGVGVALAYTAPLKTLAITGASRSKYAKKFTLPEKIWGNEADLAFLSLENAKAFSKYGKEDPIEVPFYTFGNAYAERSAADLAGVAKSEILKNVYHKNYLIRTQAAKALRIMRGFDDLEKMLGDPDPRVRRAALDGLCDYSYWTHLGRNPLSPEQFTPGMVEAVAKMLSNKKESLWVTDGALSVLSCMPPATVGKHLDLVMPWARHEDWWLRQSAFSALATAARDPKLVAQVLPTLLEMMLREEHTMPRDGMVYKLDALLRAQGPGSPAAQQILTAHLKAAAERTIIPGIRADEGEHDVGQSIDVVVRESPGQVLALAKAMQKRFGELSTAYLVKLSNDLRGAAPKVPGDQRAELEKLLYDEYRPALVDRMKTGESDAMIDAILALLALKDPDAGWREFGKVRHAERLWRYTTLEPKGADVLHPREKRRFRNITLPAELKGWFEPGFDDSGWKTGKAPIGVGIHGDPRANVPNATPWGDDEFVLMRSTFELDATDFDYVRIRVLANQGYDIYLNGRKIFTYGWWNDTHEYSKIMLDNNQKALLRKGTNHLAVLAGSDRFLKGVHVGQIDLYLEGLRKKDVLATPTSKTAQAPIAAQPAAVCYLDVEDAPRETPYPVKLPSYDYDVCPTEVVITRMKCMGAVSMIANAVMAQQVETGKTQPKLKSPVSVEAGGGVQQRWTEEKTWDWYKKQPWIAGCNFLPSTAVNDVEMWQDETFDPHTIDRELGMAESLGFNSVRVFLNYVVWKADPNGLKKRFEQFLKIADKHGIRVMPIFFDDCAFAGREPAVGKQADPVPGIPNSGWVASPGKSRVLDTNVWPDLEKYVKDMVGAFRKDNRIVIWDLYNEPANDGMGEKSRPLLEAVFKWAREMKPVQPLTVGAWANFNDPIQRRMMELSDVISFHAYEDRGGVEAKLKICSEYGRPVICTEWLLRQGGNRFETLMPMFRDRNVGCYNWGLKAGRTQTYFQWGSRQGDPDPAVWQHDIFRKDGTPYDADEVALIRQLTGRLKASSEESTFKGWKSHRLGNEGEFDFGGCVVGAYLYKFYDIRQSVEAGPEQNTLVVWGPADFVTPVQVTVKPVEKSSHQESKGTR